MNRKLNTGEISYWSSFLESLKGSNGVQIDFGSQPFTVEGETKSRSEFIHDSINFRWRKTFFWWRS